MPEQPTDRTYRDAIAELETLLRRLETETVDVDELTASAQRAADLIRFCKARLRTAEATLDRVFDALDEEDTDGDDQ
ncbi:exodeoxyribonuclease VII small subunit [Hymenobacter busanensis]|uniref:Exodeoxyribonuclease 7 small subunit n=1 Tax=Hymenobacter busanensis TaxID=2607656 RepID=A0A7L4ZYG3_9BACT|nr:exodeoxyribonuclease VII small subunit [Hymenobacter busanensis]KAA9332391.1 exodeoxyribonuclease VII small subunit [Hymenobacter busanensis]QHJ07272.1 exodeoxyribonuclease VII small subunit [Hymenobacter busanensis]